MLEDEFGDIKEPKNIIQFLFGIWVVTGVIVFLTEIKKYFKKISKKREYIDYKKDLLDYIK